MKEWRRTLKAWPKETPQIANPALLPQWVREAARERLAENDSPMRRNLKTALLTAGVIALIVFVESLPRDAPLTGVILASVVGAIPLTIATFKGSRERKEAHRRNRTTERLEALGEATLGGDFVGVSYSGEFWSYPGLGPSVDEGVVLLELDRLTFVGDNTRLDLPAHAIVGTRIRQFESGLGAQPRLYVEWASDGRKGTFALTLPYRATLRRRVEEAVDLRDRIERWRRDPFPTRATPPLLPLSMEMTKRVEAKTKTGRLANFLAVLAIFGSMFGSLIALEMFFVLVHHQEWSKHLSGIASSLTFLWITLGMSFAAKIEARLPERYRYRAKDESGVREALRKVEASTIAEPAVDARLKQ